MDCWHGAVDNSKNTTDGGQDMTHTEQAAYIGRKGEVRYPDGLSFRVFVTDVRQSYGEIELLVQPENSHASSGTAWKKLYKVHLPPIIA
jgi:hypothetical protein